MTQHLLPTRFLTSDVQKLLLRRATQPWEGKQLLPQLDSTHPAVVSDSPEFLRFQRAVRRRLSEEIPLSTAEEGLYDARGIVVPWSNASYIAGYAMNPVTVPPVDNSRLVPGLATGFLAASHELIYDRFFALCFDPSHYKAAPAHFNKLASSGAPFRRSSHPEFKLAILSWVTGVAIPGLPRAPSDKDAWRKLTELILSKKFDEAADKFAASQLFLLGFRRQSSDGGTLKDGVFTPKERLVNDQEYALSRGLRGRRFAADRRVRIRGELIPDMGCQRCRTVWGAPGWATYPITVLASQARAHYFEWGSFMWEHRGALDIESKLRDAVAIENLDVSQYDQSFQPWLVDKWCSNWARFLPEGTAAVFELMFHAPYYVPNPDVNATGGFVIGDPSTANDLHYGLPSGIAINPDMGKFHVPWAFMCILDDLYGDLHDDAAITAFVQGRYPRMAILNCGDDTVMIFRDEDTKQDVDDWFEAHSDDSARWYFKMQPEQGGTFLGHVLCRDQDRVRVLPNLFSAYSNWWMAERGVDHPSRRDYWHVGWMQRNALYQQSPEWPTYERIIEDESRRAFGRPASEWAVIAKGALQYDGINALVAAKPDLLQWRFKPDDPELDESLVAQTMTSVDADTCQRIVEVLLTK